MDSFETKKAKSPKTLKKILLGVSAVGGVGYTCLDYTDFKKENPSCGFKEYNELKISQLKEIRKKVCSFARSFLSTIEKIE